MVRVTAERDEELVARVAAGDEAALEPLLRRHWEGAFRLARGVLGETSAAEDVAQEAFLRLLRRAGQFDAQREFRPWFASLVRNAARDARTARERRARREEGAPLRMGGEPAHDPVARREEARLVREHLERLEPDCRELLRLCYEEGLTQREAAEALDCPPGTVASRIKRGLRLLGTSLTPLLGASACAPAAIEALLGASRRSVPPAPAVAALAAADAAPVVIPAAGVGAAGPKLLLAGAAALLLLGAVAWLGRPAQPLPSSGAVAAGTDPERAEPPASPPAPRQGPVAPLPAPVASAQVAGTLRVSVTQSGAPLPGELRFAPLDETVHRKGELSLRFDAAGAGTIELAALAGKAWRLYFSLGEHEPPPMKTLTLRQAATGAVLVPAQERWCEDVVLTGPGGIALPNRLDPRTTCIALGPPVDLLLEVAVAPPVLVTGRVVSHPGGQPIPNAAVVAPYGHETTSDGQGGFRLLLPRPFLRQGTLSASAPGFASGGATIDMPLEVGAPPPQSVEIALAAGTRLTARVVDEAGQPVSGAKVKVYLLTGWGYAIETWTDDEGRFVAEGIPPQKGPGFGFVDVEVRSDDHLLYERMGLLVPPSGRHLEVTLESGTITRGSVRDARGEPLRGAFVWAVLLEHLTDSWLAEPSRGYPLDLERDAEPEAEEARHEDEHLSSLTPDERERRLADGWLQTDLGSRRTLSPGTFALRLARATRWVRVEARGHARAFLPAEAGRPIAARLEAAAPLRGRVLEGSTPVEGVLLEAFPLDALGDDGSLRGALGSLPAWNGSLDLTRTDREGRFAFEGLAAGRWDLRLSRGKSRKVLRAVEAGGTHDLSWSEREPSRVRVLGEAEGARVSLFDPAGNEVELPLSLGSFEVDEGAPPSQLLELPGPGRWSLRFSAAGRRPVRRDVVVAAGQTVEVPHPELRERGAALALHLRHGAGPIDRVEARWVDATGLGEVVSIDSALGNPHPFVREGLSPGDVELRATVWDHGPGTSTARSLPPTQVALRAGEQTAVTLDLSPR